MTDCDHVWKFARDEQGRANPRLLACDWCKTEVVPKHREQITPQERVSILIALRDCLETDTLLSSDVLT